MNFKLKIFVNNYLSNIEICASYSVFIQFSACSPASNIHVGISDVMVSGGTKRGRGKTCNFNDQFMLGFFFLFSFLWHKNMIEAAWYCFYAATTYDIQRMTKILMINTVFCHLMCVVHLFHAFFPPFLHLFPGRRCHSQSRGRRESIWRHSVSLAPFSFCTSLMQCAATAHVQDACHTERKDAERLE